MAPLPQAKPDEKDSVVPGPESDEEGLGGDLSSTPEPGQKEWKAEKKQLAALSEEDANDGGKGDMQMDEKQRAALMDSLNRKDGKGSSVHVDPKAVTEVKDLLLLPGSVAEKALRKEGGDVAKAVRRLLFEEDEDEEGVLG
ncbi:conserved hypothetical protein [Neospora caninum Liverpool]|uniref:Uncharacterized protein n=1 Tax=Neospora caninum (strain Liverpool) TaxID=572307 RepID=F0VHP1_NEOCL|nr:conserved hypothetical protein [Neospora caninum Liverpool]CBZ53252.1 conserved hypothetical protein [Neospora caninum Liverpool]CEL67238.1 TPA: hypothetical protein BN1204_030390 [Neospora caninum Liverpool]|eukprot:XP_003883284.1 conserved hypothetical protein [Neospora caninum Liverpool]